MADRHPTSRINWLRAAVLGANDGLISTASLVVGVTASHAPQSTVLLAGVAGLVAGSMSMAASEYVSVSSQSDTEKSEIAREREHLSAEPDAERAELAEIYVKRGLTPELAAQVSQQLMAKDPLAAHARDEYGITAATSARPLQAALASAFSFAIGGSLPVLVVAIAPRSLVPTIVPASALILLTTIGALAARIGHAPVWRGALRVLLLGALAMIASAIAGQFFGTPA